MQNYDNEEGKFKGLRPFYGRYTGAIPGAALSGFLGDDEKCPVSTALWNHARQYQAELNHMIATLYEDGTQYMPGHSDKMTNLVDGSFIFDYSFGATRRLVFRESETKKVVHTVPLTNGSLFVLGPRDNAAYEHDVPEDANVTEPRASFIFRPTKTFKTASGMKDVVRQHLKTQEQHAVTDQKRAVKEKDQEPEEDEEEANLNENGGGGQKDDNDDEDDDNTIEKEEKKKKKSSKGGGVKVKRKSANVKSLKETQKKARRVAE